MEYNILFYFFFYKKKKIRISLDALKYVKCNVIKKHKGKLSFNWVCLEVLSKRYVKIYSIELHAKKNIIKFF